MAQFLIGVLCKQTPKEQLRAGSQTIIDLPGTAFSLASEDIVAEVETVQTLVRIVRGLQVLRASIVLVEISGGNDSQFVLQESLTVSTVVVLQITFDECVETGADGETEGPGNRCALGDEIHTSADGVTFHVWSENLRHLDRSHQVCRDRVQWDLAACILSRADPFAVDGGRTQTRLGTANQHIPALSLITLDHDGGYALSRFRCIRVREA